ncbi:Leucine-rich receptor-like protein kinase family protein [Rhynchospora pubera]|uniref:Leucine-rich receptor-like protein kinase family protein n=1 Tax=Rhynchospora pubera TaxID=906938 RepID=A0AAV8DFY2_9POAL|nr:Leucine-rich receptor-like protein kinase family protein [Rhynchospora pubera]
MQLQYDHLGMARFAIGFYITICVTLLVLSKIVVSYLLYRKWARKRRIIENCLSGGKMVIFRSTMTQSLSASSFMKMAMRLSNKDIIGSGGHGTLYQLRINDTTAFAVKKMNKGNAEIDRGFERELVAIGDIKHRNIVRLHGYYIAPQFNLLIYELMPNRSLDCFLHGKFDKKRSLDWPTRLRVAVSAARGIAYLHHDCIPHIIQRDIKSSNILLDQNMEARISDFGLATLMQPNKSHVSTVVAGTFGYLAPEYFDTGRATTKGDIYSFGVVLLELLTGKRPTDESFIENGTNLVNWVKETVKENREEETIDNAVVSFPISEIKAVFCIAEKCLEVEPLKRPTMVDVLKMLEQVK